MGKKKKILGILGALAIKAVAPQVDVTPILNKSLGINTKQQIETRSSYGGNVNDLCRCGHTRANHSFQGCTAEATVSGGIPGISGIPGQPYALGLGTTCMCRKFTDW